MITLTLTHNTNAIISRVVKLARSLRRASLKPFSSISLVIVLILMIMRSTMMMTTTMMMMMMTMSDILSILMMMIFMAQMPLMIMVAM